MNAVRFAAALIAVAALFATPAAIAQTSAGSAGYDISTLHPQVQAAVVAARAAEAQGIAAAQHARDNAGRGEAAAVRARNGEPGTQAYDSQPFGDPPSTARYETEARDNIRNGYGVQTFTSGPNVGDRYAGTFENGRKSGAGVYTHVDNQANPGNAENRYEGDYADSAGNGFGAIFWNDGETYAGQITSDHRNGGGVNRYADGRRFEGEYAYDVRTGLGVLWGADGRVISQGVWSNGELTTPLAR